MVGALYGIGAPGVLSIATLAWLYVAAWSSVLIATAATLLFAANACNK
jgi:hypothetical protein